MKESVSVSSSIITTSNSASNNEDDDEDIHMDRWPSLIDVIAVKSNECKSTKKYFS